MTSKWKAILFCSCYNLLFEFSMRGILGFFDRFLFFWLFFIYFSYFNIVIHVSSITHGSERVILATTASFGIILATLGTGIIFIDYSVIGLNILTLLIVLFVWWGVLQTFIPMYMSGKLFGYHFNNGQLKIWEFILYLIYLVIFNIIAFMESLKGPLHGYLLAGIIFLMLFIWTIWEIKREERKQVQDLPILEDEKRYSESRLLDFGFISTVVISIFSGLILPIYYPPIGARAVYQAAIWLMSFWSLILLGITVIYKIKEKRPIPLPS